MNRTIKYPVKAVGIPYSQVIDATGKVIIASAPGYARAIARLLNAFEDSIKSADLIKTIKKKQNNPRCNFGLVE